MASWAQSCPVPSLPYQQGSDTHLDSDWTCISLDDNICVTSRLGVTVLSTLITLKFIHLKFQQKYKWHLPSYKIWDATKIWSMRNKKREIGLWIVAGYESEINSWTRNYLSASFYFLFLFVQSCTTSNLSWWYMLTCSIHSYFWINLWCTNLSIIRVCNTVTL